MGTSTHFAVTVAELNIYWLGGNITLLPIEVSLVVQRHFFPVSVYRNTGPVFVSMGVRGKPRMYCSLLILVLTFGDKCGDTGIRANEGKKGQVLSVVVK
jgi:hypothetical protein